MGDELNSMQKFYDNHTGDFNGIDVNKNYIGDQLPNHQINYPTHLPQIQSPLTPTESFRFDILDVGEPTIEGYDAQIKMKENEIEELKKQRQVLIEKDKKFPKRKLGESK